MITTTILVSALCLGAIAVSARQERSSWLRNLLLKWLNAPMQATAPIITREGGWTFIRSDDEKSFNEWLGHDEEGLPLQQDEEPSLGSHLLVELYGCDKGSIEFEKHVAEVMKRAAVESEATVVTDSFHEFQPYGVSGAVIIQESHYTIHTWPEHGYAAVDLFYCGGAIKVHRAVEVLREGFGPTKIKFLVVRRGLEGEVKKYM